MKAEINRDNCIGCGCCQGICQEVFEVQDDGFAHVVKEEIEKNLYDDVRDAASACPTGAIEVKEA